MTSKVLTPKNISSIESNNICPPGNKKVVVELSLSCLKTCPSNGHASKQQATTRRFFLNLKNPTSKATKPEAHLCPLPFFACVFVFFLFFFSRGFGFSKAKKSEATRTRTCWWIPWCSSDCSAPSAWRLGPNSLLKHAGGSSRSPSERVPFENRFYFLVGRGPLLN